MIELDWSWVDGSITQEIRALSALTSLRLGHKEVSGDNLSSLSDFESLQTLRLYLYPSEPDAQAYIAI